MKTSILIDGNSLLYRMFYGIREMSNSKGIPTNAVYGFVNVLYKIENEFHPDYFAVAFDLSAPTFRHKVYTEYKGGRDKMPEELASQFVILKELLKKMDVPVIEVEGYEADDILGTLAKEGISCEAKTKIITGDKDSFQLVDDDICLLYTTTRSREQFSLVDPDYIMDRYGVTPPEMIDVKALMGDSSDNIPGVAGIGEKTATKLIAQYHSIDNLYEHIDDLKGKQKEKLIAGHDDAVKSRFLGEICTQVPIGKHLSEMEFKGFFNDAAKAMLGELEFRSILNKIGRAEEQPQAEREKMNLYYTLVEDEKSLMVMLGELCRQPRLVMDTLVEDEKAWASLRIGSQYYFLPETAMVQRFIDELAGLPCADEIFFIAHDLKNLSHFFEKFNGVIVNYTFDTMIAGYLLSPGDTKYTISGLAAKYLALFIDEEEDFYGKGTKVLTPSSIDERRLANHLVMRCDGIHQLSTIFPSLIEEAGMTMLYEKVELPLTGIMAEMETLGFKIDVKELKNLSKNFEQRLGTLTEEIYALAGESFNINSPKQLGEVLFEELKLPARKKTKTGYSTNVEILEELRVFHPIIDKVLEYRTLSKLDGTYGKGLIKLIVPETEKIHSTFNQTVAATGRLSSSDPNLQNIPVKTDIGREIRRVFVPFAEDHVLVDADYSQIELRVLAHLSEDENLIDAFVQGQDIHTRTASEIFNTPMLEVTREQRGKAKAINFGLIYGKQAFSLGKELGISRKEAQDYIDLYFDRYPKVAAYMENIVEQAKNDTYVTTMWGRRRYLPEITSRNRLLVQAGERMALNTPIQGTAADIIKMAMIRIVRRLEKEKLQARLILQVHDELIIDSPESEQEMVLALLVEEMEHAAELSVPLSVDAHCGKSWYEIK